MLIILMAFQVRDSLSLSYPSTSFVATLGLGRRCCRGLSAAVHVIVKQHDNHYIQSIVFLESPACKAEQLTD